MIFGLKWQVAVLLLNPVQVLCSYLVGHPQTPLQVKAPASPFPKSTFLITFFVNAKMN
jgi:hypothetical protein